MAIQDPHEIGMERRLLLAMVLSMAVLFLASYLYRPSTPSGPPPEISPVATSSPLELSPLGSEIPLGSLEVPATSAVQQTVEIENEHLILRWSNAGGVLESAQLKGYVSAEGVPLEIIPQGLAELQRRPLAVRTGDSELDRRLASAIYEVEGASLSRTLRAPAEISFVYRSDEVEVRRRIRVPEAGYLLEMSTAVHSRGRSLPYSVVLGPGIGEISDEPQGDFAQPSVAYYLDGSVQRINPGDVEGEAGPFSLGARWAAMDSKFFAYAVLHPGGMQGVQVTQEEHFDGRLSGEPNAIPLLVAEATLGEESEYAVFIGPKSYETLRAIDPTLGALIDYGFLSVLVRPLVLGLEFVYRYVGNYGLSIIILTLVINLVLFPLRYKQMASMKKMSFLQPQIKAIQEKYKGMKRADPRRSKMNEEVMGLYKQHGVNPLGGCLPLLVQMPFLFAFYNMLYASIELRGANFISWWIPDLSEPNILLTLMMGASMVVQQKMTPAAGDPTQRKMMLALPVVFTFFFLSLSSGLVLYFLFSNVFGMAFQVATQRLSPELALAPSKKKSVKKKKGPKT